MRYYNYLSTPSGKKLKLNELTNNEYLILLKFLNGDNYEGFYNSLNSLIIKTIPDFEELDIIDKAYIYIAFYFYSVKASIGVKAEKFDMVEVPLTQILDSIENAYHKQTKITKIFKWEKCEIGYPTLIEFDNDEININFASGIKSINDISLTNENKSDLSKNAPLQILNEIERFIKTNFDNDIYFVQNQIGVKDIKDTLLNPGLFYSIAYIYKDSLEQFYNMMYLMTHYVRIPWNSLLEMTPIELNIVHKSFIEDKEEQNKRQSNNKGTINMNDPNIADTFGGY